MSQYIDMWFLESINNWFP